MSFVRGLFEDLRGKPALMAVAVALLVALIAIPLLLAKPAKKPTGDAAAPGVTPALGPGEGAIADITNVQQTVTDQTPFYAQNGKRVRDLPRRNPFRSRAFVPGAADTAGVAGTPDASGTADTGTGTTGTPVPVSTGGESTDSPAYYTVTARVRFGEQSEKQEARTLNPLSALPSADNPILVFLGVRTDGTAVFLLSSSATTTGDGRCQPSDEECSAIYMTKGDSQTIEAVSSDGEVTTYEMKLIRIDVKKTTNPTASGSSRAKHSSKGSRRAEQRKAKRKVKRTQKRLVGVLDGVGF